MENADKALNTGARRVYDMTPSEIFTEFMENGWTPTPLTGITQDIRCLSLCSSPRRHCVHFKKPWISPHHQPGSWEITLANNAFEQGSSIVV